MARPLRLQYPGALYHVLNRGHRKEKIFYHDNDRAKFLEKLLEVKNKFNLAVYSYCLMDNHFHLLLETPEGNLSKAMHAFLSSYANWFRIKYKLVGSVFQSRYRSIIVEDESYLLQVSRYIHLNPLRAEIVKEPENFEWSSYRLYKEDIENDLIDKNLLLKNAGSVENYIYLIEKSDTFDLDKVYGKSSILGSDHFRNHAKDLLKHPEKIDEIAVPDFKAVTKHSVEDVKNVILKSFNITGSELLNKRYKNIERKIYFYILKRKTALLVKEIADMHNIKYTTFSSMMSIFKKAIEDDRILYERVVQIEKELDSM